MSADEHEGMWARSDVLPDGSYGAVVTLGADVSWSLTRESGLAYAAALFEAATLAEHDGAVVRLLVELLGFDLKTAAFMLGQLRGQRTEWINLLPGMQVATRLGMKVGPFLELRRDEKPVGELTPADARGHAGHVLGLLGAVEADRRLFELLRSDYELDTERARAMVGTLAEYWPNAGQPRASRATR